MRTNQISLFGMRLNQRRAQLGMSCLALSDVADVSLPTVKRIMAGAHDRVAFGTVLKVARALGVDLVPYADADADALREERALEKARRLTAMVQATSALEAQAVDKRAYERSVNRIAGELMRSNRKLWAA